MVKQWCEQLGQLAKEARTTATDDGNLTQECGSPSEARRAKGRRLTPSQLVKPMVAAPDVPSLSLSREQQLRDPFYVLGSRAFELYMAVQSVVRYVRRPKMIVRVNKAFHDSSGLQRAAKGGPPAEKLQ